MSAATTLRQPPTDDVGALRHIVATCLTEAADAEGSSVADWLADVRALHGAVAHLRWLADAELPEHELHAACHAAREAVALALLAVAPVHAAARELMAFALERHPDLIALRAELGRDGDDLVDRWLLSPVDEAVGRVLAEGRELVITL